MQIATFTWALTWLAGALLVVAGLPKLAGLAEVPLLPTALARPVGLLEVTVGITAIVWPTTPAALAVGVTYLLLSGALLVAIVRREPDCGCFGVEPVEPEWGHLFVDLALAAAAFAAALGRLTEPGPTEHVVSALLAVLAAVMVAELLSTGSEIRRMRASRESGS
ncbi:MAG: hypothetical protein R2716_10035 [Microthrixaceae bacterium]